MIKTKKLLAMVLLLSFMPVCALAAYVPKGDKYYELNSKWCTENGGDSVNGSAITVEDGSANIKYNFYMPFDSKTVTINYVCEKAATVQLTAGDVSANVTLSETETSKTVKLSKAIRQGEQVLNVVLNGNAQISSIRFNKIEISDFSEISSSYAVELQATDYQKATQGAVMIDLKANAIIVRGQRRYIDNANITKTPELIDGVTYLPAKSLAFALGYYIEDIPEKSYLLLRNEENEFVFIDGKLYKNVAFDEDSVFDYNLRYVNGEAYLPVRFFAEQIGKTVGWSDGLIVIDDDPFEVDNIIKNYTADVKAQFEPFEKEIVTGKTYYVSKSLGSDSNDGSKDFPFATLKQAGKVAQAGDTVIIREGVYRETFAPKNDGTATAPITFKAAEGEDVVISALEEINQFDVYEDNTYTANLGFDLGDGRNMVFYNGKALAEARYPNPDTARIEMSERSEPLSDLFPTKGDIHANPENKYQFISDTLLDQEDGHWVGATVVSAHGYNWGLCTAKIKSSTKGSFLVDESNIGGKYWYTPQTTDRSNWSYIAGHKNCMDIAGEWIVKDKALVIIPPEDVTDPKNMKLEVKKRQVVIDVANRKFVRIEGIKTIGGGVKMNNSEMCMINDCELKYISHYTHGLDQREGYIYTGNVYNSYDAPQMGEMGIYVGGTDNIITNSTIDHSAASGIYMVGTYAYIENNTVSNCGYMGNYVSGITFGNEIWKGNTVRKGGFTLYNNTVYNCGRSTLNIQCTEAAGENAYQYTSILPYEVAYNDFHDGVLFSLDTGITYEYQIYAKTDKQQSMMHNNYVYYTGAKTNPYSFAIYHDGGTIGIDTYENVVFTTQPEVKYSQDYVFHNHDDNNVWNNAAIKLAIDGGPEALETDMFPYGRPFWAGVRKDDYLVNYNRIKNNTDDYVQYKAKDAKVSDGVQIVGEEAVFSGKDQYICFEDVDFGEGNNNINISYTSDRWNTNDCIDIIVGDSIETGTIYKNNYADSFAKTEEKTDMLSVGIGETTGKQNVYLKITSYKSIRIRGISINDSGLPQVALEAEKIYGGSYTGVEKVGNATMPPVPHIGPDTVNSFVKNVWEGTILQYRNVMVEEPMTVLQYSMGTTESYGDQQITIAYQKVGDPYNTDLVTIYSPTDGWDTYNTYYADLEHTLEPGTYDFYVTFGKKRDGSGSATCNFWFFGLLPEIPTEE